MWLGAPSEGIVVMHVHTLHPVYPTLCIHTVLALDMRLSVDLLNSVMGLATTCSAEMF